MPEDNQGPGEEAGAAGGGAMTGSVVVLRVRGRAHVRRQIADTLRLLNLTRKNHCTIVPENAEYKGMIMKAKDYIAWGPADEKTVARLLSDRGKVTGGKKLSDGHVKDNSKFKDIKELAKALAEGRAALGDVKDLKPVFRLNPPVKGFPRKGIKAPHTVGGALGDRGKDIGELLGRMI